MPKVSTSRLLYVLAGAWSLGLAVLVTYATDDKAREARTFVWLAIPVLLAAAAALLTNARAGLLLSLGFVVVTVLSLASFGLFLVPAAGAMVVGSLSLARKSTRTKASSSAA